MVSCLAKIKTSVKFNAAPPLNPPLLCFSCTGMENQTAAADIFQTVDACMLTAAPLSCAPLHFNSSQSHKSTLMLTSVHQQLNGPRALQTAFYSSIGKNLLSLKTPGSGECVGLEGGGGLRLCYLKRQQRSLLFLQGYNFFIVINSYISSDYIKKVEITQHPSPFPARMNYKALSANTQDISLRVLGTEKSRIRSRNIGEAQYQNHFRQIKAKKQSVWSQKQTSST